MANSSILWTIACQGDSPGRNTEVGCHALLLGIFLTQGSNPCNSRRVCISLSLSGWLFSACIVKFALHLSANSKTVPIEGLRGTSLVNSINLMATILLMDTRWQHCTTAAASLGSPDPSTSGSFIPWPALPSFPTSFTVTWPWSDPVFKIPSSSFSPSRPLSQFCCFPGPVQGPSFRGGKNQRHEDPFPGLEGSDDLFQGPASTQSPIPCKRKLIFLSRAWRRESSPSHVFLTLLRRQSPVTLLINLHMVHTTPVLRSPICYETFCDDYFYVSASLGSGAPFFSQMLLSWAGVMLMWLIVSTIWL